MKATLESISLPALDPAGLCEFYTSVFGFRQDRERSHPPSFFLLDCGSGCNLLIMEAAGSGTETGTKGFELGIQVEDLAGVTERVMAGGGRVAAAAQEMNWGRSMIVADPEGHAVNVYVFKHEGEH